MKYLAYLLYVIFIVGFCLGGSIWLYEYQHKSGWYVVLGLCLLFMIDSPKNFLK